MRIKFSFESTFDMLTPLPVLCYTFVMFHLQSGVNVVRDAACVLLLDDDRWAKIYFGTGSIGAIWLPKKVQLQSGLDILPLALNHNAALQLGKDNNENNQNKTNKERPQKRQQRCM